MAYIKTDWQGLPSLATAINETRLDHLETQYDEATAYADNADNRLSSTLQTAIAAAVTNFNTSIGNTNTNVTNLTNTIGSITAQLPSGGVKAVGKNELVFNVQDFGAAGDGDPNKNGGQGDTAALQACIDAAAPNASNRYGSIVFIPKGYASYRFTQLRIPPGTRIESNGAVLQVVKTDAADQMGPAIIIGPYNVPTLSGANYGKYIRISDLTISGSGDPYSYPRVAQTDADPYSAERNRVGLEIRTMIDVVLKHVYVDHFKIGIHMRDVYDSKFTDVQIHACGYSYDDVHDVTVTLTDTPKKIYAPVAGDGFMVYNTSSTRSYLGPTSAVSSTNYKYAQNAGTDNSWLPNTELWAVAAPGETATIRYELAGVGEFTRGFGYALWLDEFLDTTNANKFDDCHIESCPLFIRFSSESRQNNFVNCKFENRCPIADDMSSQSMIWFDSTMENTFDACLFTEDYTRQKPVIRADTPVMATLTNYQGAQAATFIGCIFFAARSAQAMWFKGSYATFLGNIFNRTGGGLAVHPFNIGTEVQFAYNRIVFADLNVKCFRITAGNNTINNNNVIAITGTNSGNFVQLDAGAVSAGGNIIDMGNLTGSVSTRLAIAAGTTDLGTNVITHKGRPYPSSNVTNNSATPGVGMLEFMYLSYNTPTTITNFLQGYTGQRLTIISTNSNVTYQNNANLVTLSGADTAAIAGRGATTWINTGNGVWKQV